MNKHGVKRAWLGRAVLAAAASTLTWSASAQAATRFYTGLSGGAWNNLVNWNTVEAGGGATGVPVAGDAAVIRGGTTKSVLFDGNYASPLASLEIDSSSGATLTLTQPANIMRATTVSVGVNGNGVYSHSGGSLFASGLNIGNSIFSTGMGTYNLSGSASVSSLSTSVGNVSPGAFIQSGGTHSISGTFYLAIGYIGATANYTMSGGGLTFGSGIWGYAGSANFTQSAGTATGTSVEMGGSPSGTGVVNISGSASLSFGSGAVSLGGSGAVPGGTGILNVSGGSFTGGALTLHDTGPVAPGGTRVNLTGGTLSLASIFTSGNPSRFNWTGGTLAVTGASGLTFGPNGLSAGLAIAPGQLLNVTNTLTVNANSLLNINGGSVTAGAVELTGDAGRLNWVRGQLSITGPGGMNMTPGSGIGANLAVNSGCTLAINNSLSLGGSSVLLVRDGAVSAGSINNSGEIHLLGPLSRISGGALTNNTLLTGEGRIANSLTNFGEVRATGSERLVFTSAPNTNSGKIICSTAGPWSSPVR